MSPRTFVSRTAALLALVALGAACETKTIVQPVNKQPVGVTVSPQSATLTTVGQTAQFVALVTGGDDATARTVSWSSSNTAVATVDANGVVTAKANGTTSIIATSTADATAKGAALVTVAISGGGTQPSQPATVSIANITNAAGTIIANYAGITGTIIVNANVDAPAGTNATAVNFQLNGKTVCSQTITAGKATQGVTAQAADAVTFSCPIKTDSIANGVPVYANGPYTITVSLAGTTASASQAVTFANVNAVGIGVSATATGTKFAKDAIGLQWQGGPLTVNLQPQVFTGGTTVSTLTVGVGHAGAAPFATQTVTVPANNGLATVTFRADTAGGVGLLGLEGSDVVISVTGVTAAGNSFDNAGNAFTTGNMRYDDKAPVIGAPDLSIIAPNGWMGGRTTFSIANFNSSVADGGVDNWTIQYQFAPAGSSSSSSAWAQDTTIAQVQEQAGASTIARIRVCDALGNCANSAATGAFGVDLTAPTVVNVSTPADTIDNAAKNSAESVVMTVTDNLSGFAGNFTQVIVTKDSANSSGADVQKCVDPNTGALSSVGSGCSAVALNGGSTTFTIPAPATWAAGAWGNGYYTVQIRATDAAGNRTSYTTKFLLVDVVAPTVTITSVGLAGNIPTITGTLKDNVELGSYQPWARFATPVFGTVTDLPLAPATTVGTYGLPLSGNASPTASGAFGSVQASLGAAGIVQLASAGFTAADVAGNPASAFQALAGVGGGVNAADINSAIAPTASPASICQSGTSSAACTTPSPAITATSTTLTAGVLFNAGTTTANPLKAVYFYTPASATTATLLGVSSAAAMSVNTSNQRAFTFQVSVPAAAFPATGAAVPVYAIGVDANGNGVLLGTTNVAVY